METLLSRGAVQEPQRMAFHRQAKLAFRSKPAGFGFRMAEWKDSELTSCPSHQNYNYEQNSYLLEQPDD